MFMKKIYTSVFVLSFLLLAGCSKDFLKAYDDRIIGTWQITDVDRFGIGGSINNLPFRDGSFSFMRDGSMTFTSSSGEVFKGTWDIQKKILNNDDRTTYHSLQDTAINFTTQEVLSQYYDDINFTEQIMSRQKSFQPHIPTLLIWKDNVPTKQLNFSQLSLYLSSTNSSYNSYANCSFYP